jgi:hypothetical protein
VSGAYGDGTDSVPKRRLLNTLCLRTTKNITHNIYQKSSEVVLTHHVTRHNTPIHNILSTAHQLSIYHKALGTLPEDGNVIPKHVGATIHN